MNNLIHIISTWIRDMIQMKIIHSDSNQSSFLLLSWFNWIQLARFHLNTNCLLILILIFGFDCTRSSVGEFFSLLEWFSLKHESGKCMCDSLAGICSGGLCVCSCGKHRFANETNFILTNNKVMSTFYNLKCTHSVEEHINNVIFVKRDCTQCLYHFNQ